MKLTIQPFDKVVDVPCGSNARSALLDAGIPIRGDCGGKGLCGKCLVVVPSYCSTPTPAEEALLDSEQLKEGARLACRVTLIQPTKVFVPVTSIESRLKILVDGASEEYEIRPSLATTNLSDILEKCPRSFSWEAIKTCLMSGDLNPQSPSLYLLRQLADNAAQRESRTELISRGWKCLALEEPATRILGLAVDIGTTTIVGYLHDLFSGALRAH